ncbi:PREDICTED: aminopeptidase N-like [Dinoponera quadriceps]|uniref:Aminopeptidase N-like n=1 Tax=Dinoponera quadriceps TaxID=609295 RepID=A0A6P3Y937_DINQU|nr:PREDICTED: aminopeptidase N-like [Dinoponera quadriceps]
MTGIGVTFLIFGASLIFAVVNDASGYLTSCSLSALDYHLPSEIVPRHYNILLIQKKDGKTFSGYSDVLIEVIRKIERIIFHTKDLLISLQSVRLRKHERSHDSEHTIVNWKDHSYCNLPQVHIFNFHEKLSPGNYTLSLNFDAKVHSSQGFVVTRNLNVSADNTLAYITLFERISARRLFPCWDEPKFKATFNISVVHSSTTDVLSNMPHTNETFNLKDTSRISTQQQKQTTFQTTPVMSTYLVTIVIVDTALYHVSGKNIIQWLTKLEKEHMPDIQEIVKKTNKFLRSNINKLWINDKFYILTYRNLISNAVGAWGFAVFRESDLIYDSDSHFSGRLIDVQKTVAKQITRQNIESFVSPLEWSHQWFSNAFATYFSYQIVDEIREDNITSQLFIVQVLQPALHNDIELNVPPVIHDNDPFYSSLIYKKASAIINMFGYVTTRRVLRKALKEYIKNYAYGSATPTDFLKALQNKMQKFNVECNCNITSIMHTWFGQRSHPTLLIQRSYNDITIKPYKRRQSQNSWPVPVTYTTEKLNFARNLSTMWLNTSAHNSVLKINADQRNGLIIFNVQQFGYYRTYYDFDNLKKIIGYLNYDDFTKIHVLNRAQIIDDVYHFVINGEYNYVDFYELIEYLRDETSFIVWHSMMNILHYMSPFLNFPESAKFKELILGVMGEALSKIGYNESPDDKEMLKATRLLLLNWACKHGHDECRKKAQNKLKANINGKSNDILPGWEHWTYCAGLMTADKFIVHKTWDRVLQAKNQHLLQYSDCIDNDSLLKELVSMIITRSSGKWTEVSTDRLKTLYRSVVKKHARKQQILDYILHAFFEIMPNHMTTLEKILDIIMSLYSTCQLNQISEYINGSISWYMQRSKAEHWTTFRLNQINKQKYIFARRFHNNRIINEC